LDPADQPGVVLIHRQAFSPKHADAQASAQAHADLFLGLLEAGFAMGAYLLVQASSVAFCTIVFCQVGVLLACRSEDRSGLAMLKVANPLLWLGLLSEGLVLAALL